MTPTVTRNQTQRASFSQQRPLPSITLRRLGKEAARPLGCRLEEAPEHAVLQLLQGRHVVAAPHLGGLPRGPVVRPDGGDALVQHALLLRQCHAVVVVDVDLPKLDLVDVGGDELLPNRRHLLAGATARGHVLYKPQVLVAQHPAREGAFADGLPRAVRHAQGGAQREQREQGGGGGGEAGHSVVCCLLQWRARSKQKCWRRRVVAV
mmetsp:Transcript_21663/g.53678  ORF Transcript_21663/g.53678 Transcript_21663/m.53678 type:complete len:207 (-) Transcript_21663:4-624(-)